MRTAISILFATVLIVSPKASSLSLIDIPFGVQLECRADHAADLAAGKSLAIANSNRISCHSNWRSWYKGNVSYITNECPNCTDQFTTKFLDLTSACLDSDKDFIDQVKSREGMSVSPEAAKSICNQRRSVEADLEKHRKVQPVTPPAQKARGFSI